MRRRAAALLGLLWALSAGSARAALVNLTTSTVSDPHQLVGRQLPLARDCQSLTAFPEKLVYDVSWGMIDVGQATLEVQEIVDFNGKPAYHIVSRATSNNFCDTFYKVRDLNESWMDAITLSSLGYSKSLREGRFFREEWTLFQDGHWVGKWAGRDLNFSVALGTCPIGVQDVLSSMFYLRGKTLTPGTQITLDVNTRQNWPLQVNVVRKEKVKTPAGKFDAFLVEPTMRHEGLFIQKGNRLRVWLSDDPKRVPVQMKVDVFFGSITARLSKMVY